MHRIKKNDKVVVISGKEKGKSGAVNEISSKKNAVKIKNIMIVSKHQKARKAGEVASIKKIESWIDISKVMPFCTICQKPVRVQSKKLESGMSARACTHCKEVF